MAAPLWTGAGIGNLRCWLFSFLTTTFAPQDQAPAPAAPPPDTPGEPPSPRAAGVAVGVPGSGGGGAALPGGVEKLLCLELEVVQLQQSLQIAQLEFEARTVQLHSLKQRADDAEQRAQVGAERGSSRGGASLWSPQTVCVEAGRVEKGAIGDGSMETAWCIHSMPRRVLTIVQAAEERAAGLAQQAHALEQQAGDLQCQLGEAAARQQQVRLQGSCCRWLWCYWLVWHGAIRLKHPTPTPSPLLCMQLSARLAAAASKQQAAEEAAAGLRQQLAAAQQASEQAHAELRRAAAAQGEWQERAAAARHEGQQLKVHVAAACGALKALGIPVHKVRVGWWVGGEAGMIRRKLWILAVAYMPICDYSRGRLWWWANIPYGG